MVRNRDNDNEIFFHHVDQAEWNRRSCVRLNLESMSSPA